MKELGRRHAGYGVTDAHYGTVAGALLWTSSRPRARVHARRQGGLDRRLRRPGDDDASRGTRSLKRNTLAEGPTVALGCYRRRMRFDLQAIGVLSSELTSLADAPMQGSEGAPDAWLEVDASFADALRGIEVGDELIVITWFHRAVRETLQTRPRSDPRNPLTGVFATRSPDRPNPLGLHPVTVRALDGNRLRVGPIEAIDGTPVVDIKPALSMNA